MPGKRVNQTKRVNMVGPGSDAALKLLGHAGRLLRRKWSGMSEDDLLETEAAALQLHVRDACRYDESRRSTRWLAYGRLGVVCAVLRAAGLRARGIDGWTCRAAG